MIQDFEEILMERDVPLGVRIDAVNLCKVLLSTSEDWGMDCEHGIKETKREVRAWFMGEGMNASVTVEIGNPKPKLSFRTVLGSELVVDVFRRIKDQGIKSFKFDVECSNVRFEGDYDVGIIQVKVAGGEGWEDLATQLEEAGLKVVEV